jgi:alkanesulfonate monooxygenase SsuD/methylene tetrahydromethanopterin reductase-like flavin-dependent oxidoreductase (luciferase family)
MRFGVHAGPQDCSIDDLRRLWAIADGAGFHWCSVWDHLYSVSDLTDPTKPCFEGITAMTAAARRRRAYGSAASSSASATGTSACSSKAATSIDTSRVAAASSASARAGTRPSSTRSTCRSCRSRTGLDQVEESAIVIRRLLDGERVTFQGKQISVTNAVCSPRPVQPKLRLWIGGPGREADARIVARHADGWNVPFLAPEVFEQRNAVLTQWCEKEKRDPRSIIRTANVGLAIGADAARVQRQEENLKLMFGG